MTVSSKALELFGATMIGTLLGLGLVYFCLGAAGLLYKVMAFYDRQKKCYKDEKQRDKAEGGDL